MKKLRKKVVLLGAFGVGKTSLVRRFVSNEFSEDYLSTIGVRVEKAVLNLDEVEIELMIWDLAGHDEFAKLQLSYLRGASGVILVADMTRAWTVRKAQEILDEFGEHIDKAPWVYVLNKSDLPADLGLDEAVKGSCFDDPKAFLASAKTGNAVLDAFHLLAKKIVQVGS